MIIEKNEWGDKLNHEAPYFLSNLMKLHIYEYGNVFSEDIYKLFYLSKSKTKLCKIVKKYFEDGQYKVIFSVSAGSDGSRDTYKFYCPQELCNLDYSDYQTMYILSLYEPKKLFKPFCICETFTKLNNKCITGVGAVYDTKTIRTQD